MNTCVLGFNVCVLPQIGHGKEFKPAQYAMVQKHQDLDPAKPYPYMADRSEGVDALREAKR